MKRTALVLGTNAGQADLIRFLRSTGWTVVACSHEPVGPGVALAHRFELISIIDIERVTRLAQDEGVSLIYSVSSDLAIPTVVEVSERLDLPHFFDSKLVDLLINKLNLRAWLGSAGLGPVEYLGVSSLNEARGWSRFPCIVKPGCSQGQRGVALVHDQRELSVAVETALAYSRSKDAIIEEHLTGVEVSSNVLVSGGELIVNEITERLVHPLPLVGIPRGHLLPPTTPLPTQLDAASALVRDVVRELRIRDGILYFQIMVTSQGPRVLEIAPRLDGCHIWRLIEAAQGFNLIDLMMRPLLGEPVAAPRQRRAASQSYELIFQQLPPGIPVRLADFPAPADAIYHEYRYEEGETVRPVNGHLEVIGYYVRRTHGAKKPKEAS